MQGLLDDCTGAWRRRVGTPAATRNPNRAQFGWHEERHTWEKMQDASLAEALRKASPRIASHMNGDHSASLRAYLGHYGGLPEGEYDVWMTGVEARGFVLEYRIRDGTLTAPKHKMVAPFPRPITSASQVRAHQHCTQTALQCCICAVHSALRTPQVRTFAVEMHAAAFKALGVRFRLRHGYYMDAAQQGQTKPAVFWWCQVVLSRRMPRYPVASGSGLLCTPRRHWWVIIATQAARHASAGISKALRRRRPLSAGSGRLVWAAAAALVGLSLGGKSRHSPSTHGRGRHARSPLRT